MSHTYTALNNIDIICVIQTTLHKPLTSMGCDTPQAAAVVARGKKAKSKKAKEKYGDQDEDDRLLAMAILGSAGMP